MPIVYIAGKEYCVLTIPKQKALQYQIDNPDEVVVRTTDNGIVVENKNAGVTSTSRPKQTDTDISFAEEMPDGTIKVTSRR